MDAVSFFFLTSVRNQGGKEKQGVGSIPGAANMFLDCDVRMSDLFL